MHCIEKDRKIDKIINLFYRLRLWHKAPEKVTLKDSTIKFSISIYPFLFPISLLVGAVSSKNTDEKIFLTNVAIMCSVLSLKFSYLIWKRDDIVQLLQTVCAHCIEDYNKFNYIERKLNNWSNAFGAFFYLASLFGASLSLLSPLVGAEKKIFFNIGFPWDYKNDETAYWIAYGFTFTEVSLFVISVLFSLLMWYLLLNCGLKYEVLGNRLRNMGMVGNKVKVSQVARQELFHRDFIAGIESHMKINELTEAVMSFLSEIVSIQLITSALSICCSIYCLAFNEFNWSAKTAYQHINDSQMNSENLIEMGVFAYYLLYCTFDIFSVMYFGNEIKLKTDELSYCLFESSWIEQTLDCKKLLIIFGERLKQPKELVVLKLYPLTLVTFSRILNSAYSMLNILKNFKS